MTAVKKMALNQTFGYLATDSFSFPPSYFPKTERETTEKGGEEKRRELEKMDLQ